MSDNNENETEYRDVTPGVENLPGKGRAVITLIVGGLVLGILTIVAMRVRPVGLAFGSFGLVFGIQMMLRRKRYNFKMALVIAIAGFLMLLANPRFGVVAGFAGYFLITGAIALVVIGLGRAIKLSWDMATKRL